MTCRIVPAGDAALLIEWPARIDVETSRRVVSLAAVIWDRCGARIRDVVVGYCSVTVYYDPLRIDPLVFESELRVLASDVPAAPVADGPIVEVPVCYGGAYGPDLADVAVSAGLTIDEVIALHSGATYRVYVVGFVPGFPYMAAVDTRIALPRRATPRARVPAGSVAIAAGQTGIYPADTPGGWHLIGRTHVKPYDQSRADAFLFHPGDRVRFHPIERADFERA